MGCFLQRGSHLPAELYFSSKFCLCLDFSHHNSFCYYIGSTYSVSSSTTTHTARSSSLPNRCWNVTSRSSSLTPLLQVSCRFLIHVSLIIPSLNHYKSPNTFNLHRAPPMNRNEAHLCGKSLLEKHTLTWNTLNLWL